MSAIDVAGGGAVALWRDHHAVPAATSTTASNAIHHQCHRRDAIFRSGSFAGSVMSRMLLAWEASYRDYGARRSQTPVR